MTFDRWHLNLPISNRHLFSIGTETTWYINYRQVDIQTPLVGMWGMCTLRRSGEGWSFGDNLVLAVRFHSFSLIHYQLRPVHNVRHVSLFLTIGSIFPHPHLQLFENYLWQSFIRHSVQLSYTIFRRLLYTIHPCPSGLQCHGSCHWIISNFHRHLSWKWLILLQCDEKKSITHVQECWQNHRNGHISFSQHRIHVDATSWHCVPPGSALCYVLSTFILNTSTVSVKPCLY